MINLNDDDVIGVKGELERSRKVLARIEHGLSTCDMTYAVSSGLAVDHLELLVNAVTSLLDKEKSNDLPPP